MNNEPQWRRILNWGCVIAFFAFPVIFFILQILAAEMPGFHFEEQTKYYTWTRDYFRLIALLVFGMAGLNSWDRHNGKK